VFELGTWQRELHKATGARQTCEREGPQRIKSRGGAARGGGKWSTEKRTFLSDTKAGGGAERPQEKDTGKKVGVNGLKFG